MPIRKIKRNYRQACYVLYKETLIDIEKDSREKKIVNLY